MKNTPIYLVDVYVEGCQWDGFDMFPTLAKARAHAKGRYDDESMKSHLCDYRMADAAERYPDGEVSALETWTWRDHSSDYATIFKVKVDGARVPPRAYRGST